MDTLRDPCAMTAEERSDELVGILARGLVRAVRAARSRALGPDTPAQKDPAASLELSQDASLSVAPRPAG